MLIGGGNSCTCDPGRTVQPGIEWSFRADRLDRRPTAACRQLDAQATALSRRPGPAERGAARMKSCRIFRAAHRCPHRLSSITADPRSLERQRRKSSEPAGHGS
jgi:hypothetical protein